MGRARAEVVFFRSVADDEPARRDAEGAELRVDFGEEHYVFLYRQTAYVAQYWLVDFGVVE